VQTVVESTTTNASFAATSVPAGPFYVRLTKEGQDPEIQGDWVTCGVGRDAT
jgi:hypothetical protein